MNNFEQTWIANVLLTVILITITIFTAKLVQIDVYDVYDVYYLSLLYARNLADKLNPDLEKNLNGHPSICHLI